jgi:hypothetical protein
MHHSFQSLIGRLFILSPAAQNVLLSFSVWNEELTLEEHVKNEAEFILAKGYFAEVMSTCPSNIIQLDCWIYVLPSE